FHNIYKFDLITDELTLVLTDKRFTAAHIFEDNDMRIRVAKEDQEDGSVIYFRVRSNVSSSELRTDEDHWQEYLRVQPEEAMITRFVGFDKTNENAYWIWGEGSDLGTLIVTPFDDFSDKKTLYEAKRAQMGAPHFHPQERTILWIAELYHHPEWTVIDDSVREEMLYLEGMRPNSSICDIQLSLSTHLNHNHS
ncbi:hypothetical protein PMAYCL1PPCAC_31047, partial [Pristionchus mayeri]